MSQTLRLRNSWIETFKFSYINFRSFLEKGDNSATKHYYMRSLIQRHWLKINAPYIFTGEVELYGIDGFIQRGHKWCDSSLFPFTFSVDVEILLNYNFLDISFGTNRGSDCIYLKHIS